MNDFYVIELLEECDSNRNDRAYIKGERLIAWEDTNCYRIANNNCDFVPKEIVKRVYKVEFEEI